MKNSRNSIPAEKLTPAILAVVLGAMALLLYHPVIGFEFITLDDDVNVSGNPYFGSSPLAMVARFWREAYQQLYIPMTYTVWAGLSQLSLIFHGRLDPGWFHLANGLFHALNSFLVALAIRIWRPQLPLWAVGLGAVFFLVHPMQVEPVAWVTGFKDVFSTTCALASLLVYLKNREGVGSQPNRWGMGLSWCLFVAALLSKPSHVFLWGVFALLEWDARRASVRKGGDAEKIIRLALFILPVFAVIYLTREVQSAEQASFTAPIWLRPVVALDAVGFYFIKTIVPHPIAIDYGRMPQRVLENLWAVPYVLVPGLIFAGMIRFRNWALPGALFWLAALAPTLGLVPFVFQGISTVADRYQYAALAGMALLVAEASVRISFRHTRWVAGAVLVVLGFLSAMNLRHWSDSVSLFNHALRSNPRSFLSYDGLGIAFYESGRYAESVVACEKALEIKANFTSARTHLADSLMALGRTDEAIFHYRSALRSKPGDSDVLNNLAVALAEIGNFDEAVTLYRRALEGYPDNLKALNNLGLAMDRLGRLEEAEEKFRHVLRIHARQAEAHGNLANVLVRTDRKEEAVMHYQHAIKIKPNGVEFYHNLANALVQLGRAKEGRTQMERALAIEPENVGIQTGLAWMLATAPERSIRDGARAVELAMKAKRSSTGSDPQVLRVLAAAQAENGDFAEALRSCQQALKILGDEKRSGLAKAIRRDFDLYKRNQSFPATE